VACTRGCSLAAPCSNIYISVPSDSSIQSVADLRGRKVAVTKGTATHRAIGNILEKLGMTEKDVRLINMETNVATSRPIRASWRRRCAS
jgi:ABC-type nitrate/sulfonate/bicarbonate transport system substrate-binding protein